MSKFSLPRQEKKEKKPAIPVDPGKLESFAAGAGDRLEQRPWAEHDPKASPRHTVSVRLNDYHLTMLQYVAEAMDTSQQKILRKHLLPLIEAQALEASDDR